MSSVPVEELFVETHTHLSFFNTTLCCMFLLVAFASTYIFIPPEEEEKQMFVNKPHKRATQSLIRADCFRCKMLVTGVRRHNVLRNVAKTRNCFKSLNLSLIFLSTHSANFHCDTNCNPIVLDKEKCGLIRSEI